jgi:hypothetical protein
VKYRLRRLLIGRMLGGDIRRWVIYFGVSFGWRQFRKLTSPPPEVVYKATFRPGERFAMATSKPLPRRLRTKRVRKALVAAAKADVASAPA